MRYTQLVIRLAGSGKSTYCKNVFEHCQSIGRIVLVVNLDPAADHFESPVSIDIQELISLEDVIEDLKLGPNGGLVYCMEYPSPCMFLDPDVRLLFDELNVHMAPRFRKLNHALAELVDDYSMVNFVPLNIQKEDSIQYLLSCINNCIQYGEDLEPKLKD